EEGAEFAGIFLAGPRLDAAGHVHGVRAHRANRLGDVFRCEAAGEDDAVRSGEFAREGPVNGSARAAELIWPVRVGRSVQQERGGRTETREKLLRKIRA